MQKLGRVYTLLVFTILLVGATNAQTTLSLNQAVQTALKNSYDIQLVENTVAIAKNNNNIGVAGALPTVTSTVNNNKSLSTIEQKFADPTRNTTKTGVDGNTLTAGLTASVIIFNGYRIMTTKDRLATIEKQSEQQLQTQLANTTATVMQQYYNIIRQQAYLKTIEKSIEASKQRLDIVETRQKIGVANQADYLQSNLDLNALIQGKQNQLLIIDQAKADLLNTMVLPTTTSITIQEDIKVDSKISLAEVESKIKANPILQSAEQLININQFIEKETKALMYPTLRASTGYNVTSSSSAAGFSLLNESYGPFLGLNLSIPLYGGGVAKHSLKTAKLNTNSARLQYKNAELDLSTELYKTYQSYQNNLQQIPTESDNFKMSQSLLELVMQKFQLGQATMVDVKQAQQSFENAGFRLVSLRFNAKIAEIELKRLSNQLTF
ncbi:MAG: TolC family protein [Bacteroidetes bacterium]|nr:TolC family protein [Bacteroidota bacterium]